MAKQVKLLRQKLKDLIIQKIDKFNLDQLKKADKFKILKFWMVLLKKNLLKILYSNSNLFFFFYKIN